MHYHLNKLFLTNGILNESEKETKENQDLNIEKQELKTILSRRNSAFINYFENRLNIPDSTFESLKEAVDYIVNTEKTAKC